MNKKLLTLISQLELNNELSNEQAVELNIHKTRLENIRENRIKGSMIISRAQLNKDWEKPRKI